MPSPVETRPKLLLNRKHGEVVGAFASGTFGPRLWASSRGWGVAWVARDAEGGALVDARGLGDGRLGSATQLARLAGEPKFFGVSGGSDETELFLVGSVAPGTSTPQKDETGYAKVLALFAKPRGEPVARELVVTTGEIAWADILWAGQVPIVVWADAARGGGVELWIRTFQGGDLGPAERLARSLTAWQVRACGERLCALWATRGESAALEWVELDKSGKAQLQKELTRVPEAIRGLDFAETTSGYFIAYAAGTELGSRLYGLSFDKGVDTSLAPKRLSRERGEQRLRELHSVSGRPWIVWSESVSSPREGESWMVAEVPDAGFLEPTFAIQASASDGALPLFAARDQQLMGIRHAQSQAGLEWFRLGAGGVLVAPFRLSGLVDSPNLAWDLSCQRKTCLALGAPSIDDLTVFWTSDETLSFSPDPTARPSRLTKLVSDELIGRGPRLAAWASTSGMAQAKPGGWLATLTHFDPALSPKNPRQPSDGRSSPEQAHLTLLPLTFERSEQVPVLRASPVTKVSLRAQSSGGVSLVEPDQGGGLLAWSALDAGAPHVFLTALDAEGRKVKQVMLPHKGQDISNVTALRTDTGYVVAWTESDGATAALWAQHTDRNLGQLTRPIRLASPVFSPSQLLFRSTNAGLRLFFVAGTEAYSDLAPDKRVGLFSVGLSPGAVAFVGTPELHYETPTNLHSIVPLGEKGALAFAWLETLSTTGVVDIGRVRIGRAEVGSQAKMSVTEVALEVTSFAADCDDHLCKMALVRREGDRASIWGAAGPVEKLSQAEFSRFLTLAQWVSSAVSPMLMGDTVVYATASGDDGLELRGATVDFGQIPSSQGP